MRAFRWQVNGMVLQGHSAEVPSNAGAHFQRSMGFASLKFLARAGKLLQNTELYKEIYKSTVYISVLLAKPETHILNKRRSTERWNLVKKKRRQETITLWTYTTEGVQALPHIQVSSNGRVIGNYRKTTPDQREKWLSTELTKVHFFFS